MAKRTKGKGKPLSAAKGLTVGNMKDGARPSRKGQVSALLPANKVGSGKSAGRMKRMAKMEKADLPV